MRNRRLFWKILLSFWLTLFLIIQGVWVLFEVDRARRGFPDPSAVSRSGAPLLTATAELVRTSGPAGFDMMANALPPFQRDSLELLPGRPRSILARRVPIAQVLARRVTGPDGRTYVVRYRDIRRSRMGFIPPQLLILGLLGGLLFSGLLAWYLTEPIHRLRRGFDQLAHGNLTTRLGGVMGRRRDEIADLARDFDGMAQRLEQLVAARDRLLHDVSHELRSPLSRLQLAIALARQTPARSEASLNRIEREAERLEALIAELLALARAEHDATGEGYFDLSSVVAAVIDDARFQAEADGIDIRLIEALPADEDRPALRGDAELLRRAIDNVLRNALRFSPANGQVDVRLGHETGNGSYQITVEDRGPGVAVEQIATIFDPFVRGEGAGGHGLGLSIAHRAVTAHGGTMVARNRNGGGFSITITLPLS